MVEKLTEMTIERLQLYQKRNGGRLPDRIFVYRDGVSEVRNTLISESRLLMHRGCASGPIPPCSPARIGEDTSRIQADLAEGSLQARTNYRHLRQTSPCSVLADRFRRHDEQRQHGAWHGGRQRNHGCIQLRLLSSGD